MTNVVQYIANNLVSSTNKPDETLGQQLQDFYSRIKDYPAFDGETNKPEFWVPIKKELITLLGKKSQCRVLEFGCGKTGFGPWLGELRENVIFDVQDITITNGEHLKKVSDGAFFEPLTSIKNKYDLIFSTFVWEHVSNPQETLKHLLGLLNPGGSLFIVSPRFDFPFYLSNSTKHLSLLQKLAIGLWLLFRRVLAIIKRQPSFIIHLDPAVFHIPFYRDTDAVHWVSYFDLKFSLTADYIMKKNFTHTQKTLKGKFWEQFLLLDVRIQKKII